MDTDHLKELIALENDYWWHTAKRKLTTMLLRKHFPPPGALVEGGIGSGRNLLEFQTLGYDTLGLDVLPAAIEHAKHRDVQRVIQHDLSQPWPLPSHSIDVVVLLDVIEHLPNPVDALRHAHGCLKSGGGVILTVPAYAFLYGTWDQRLGHYRRYSKSQLRQETTAAGFVIKSIQHWNSFTLPPALCIRLYDKLNPRDAAPEFPRIPPLANALLKGLAMLERNSLRVGFPVPAGLSLVGVLTKP